jgi:hypothetical protein
VQFTIDSREKGLGKTCEKSGRRRNDDDITIITLIIHEISYVFCIHMADLLRKLFHSVTMKVSNFV